MLQGGPRRGRDEVLGLAIKRIMIFSRRIA